MHDGRTSFVLFGHAPLRFALLHWRRSGCFLLLSAMAAPTFSTLALLLFVATIGQIMADVMADTVRAAALRVLRSITNHVFHMQEY
jgi:hypothetical protein